MTTATARHSRPDTAVVPRGGNHLAGTGALVRFILRRDRVRIPVWVAALGLTTIGTAASFPDLYPTAEDRQARATLMSANPTSVAMSGPGHGIDDYTYGAMMSNEMLGFVAIFAALMSVLMIVRHTRAEEETGRAELVRAAVVGRYAHVTAALIAVVGTNLALGLLIAVGLGGSGIESIGWSGSFLYGAAVASVGIVFAGVAAVTAQVTEHARGASGMAGAVIGVAFALRAAGDIGNGALSWFSPIGWAQATRVYVDDRWWPLGIAVVAAALLVVFAFALSRRRDVGAGLIAQRPGPASGTRFLGTPLGLALRLQRANLIGWAIALFVFGAVYGQLIGEVETFSAENEALNDFLPEISGATLIDSFVALIVSLLAMVCSIYAVQATLRLRSEETAGRAEPVLSTALSRTRWMLSHATVALVGSSVILALSGVGLGASAAATLSEPSLFGDVVGATLAYLPTLWVTVGLAAALFGVVPQATAAAWAVIVYALSIGMLGNLLQLPAWSFDISPFTHVPPLPGAELTWTPLIVLTAVATALIAIGVAGFRRRDVYTN